MPLFSRFKSKGTQPASKTKASANSENGSLVVPVKPRYQSQWGSKEVVPEEVAELVHTCTVEMKSRAEALDAPFLLLPFRPDSDSQGARSFIRNFFKSNAEGSSQFRGAALQQELRLTEAIVLCSILKWCWSRIPDGVVGWSVYEAFQLGEKESKMARNAFHTFIPIGAASEARTRIIFDFFDLLAAVAAHGKMNGLGGRKLSRLAGWWAFEHVDAGNGFEGGYRSWSSAANASSHLFFAYLRSLSPDTDPSLNVIERIPRSLQALLASTEYPPEVPALLQRATPRVLMLVDTVSPGPFALLRRAKNFEYRDKDEVLREFQEFDDPIEALTDECKRVLYAIATINSTTSKSRSGPNAKPDEAWSAFSNLGFSDLDEKALSQKSSGALNGAGKTNGRGMRSEALSRDADGGRPTTPSWADFLSSGFTDDDANKSAALLYPPAHVLPPLGNRVQTASTINVGEIEDLSPGELAAITTLQLDDAFWWVWMTSLAGEEPPNRKAVFGRCALIETTIMNGRWLIMEEQVKGASPEPVQGAYLAPKKSRFSFTKRARLGRKKSTNKQPAPAPIQQVLSATPSRVSIAPDQHAKIKAAAVALTRKQDTSDNDAANRRGRFEESRSTKTNSMLTLGLQSEAGPAMQWTHAYDKNAIRAQYLGDSEAGRGKSREDLFREYTAANKQSNRDSILPADSVSAVGAAAISNEVANRDLPLPPPVEEPAVTAAVAAEPAPVKVDVPVSHTNESTEPKRAPDASVRRQSSHDPMLSQPASVPGSTLPRQSDAFYKEIEVDVPSSPESPKIGRKAVPRPQDHPAFRQSAPSSPPSKPATPQNPAALAAARAMQAKSSSPESVRSDQSKLKKQATSQGGFKKLFGKKKETSPRSDSFDIPRPNANSLAAPAEGNMTRRISIMRKKSENTSPKIDHTGFAAPPQPEPTVPNDSLAAAQAVMEPPKTHEDILEQERAVEEFSRFDQGPLEDVPAATPEFENNEPAFQPEQHDFSTAAPTRATPTPGLTPAFETEEFVTPMERLTPAEDNASEKTMDARELPVTQDRWATIRENAARRAARADEQPSRPSQGQRTDDGDTSGEETIESRVARIKARVAELTGNIDVHR